MNSVQLDHTMIALADQTRRAILQRLSRGEARVTELAKPFDMSLNAVSKHIMILERAGLVQRRRKGREHFLSVNAQPLDDAARWITDLRVMWEVKLGRLDDYIKDLQAKNRKNQQAKEK